MEHCDGKEHFELVHHTLLLGYQGYNSYIWSRVWWTIYQSALYELHECSMCCLSSSPSRAAVLHDSSMSVTVLASGSLEYHWIPNDCNIFATLTQQHTSVLIKITEAVPCSGTDTNGGIFLQCWSKLQMGCPDPSYSPITNRTQDAYVLCNVTIKIWNSSVNYICVLFVTDN